MPDNSWVDKLLFEIVSGKSYRRLIQKCIDNMSNKKLYKYYSFSSEFTIGNIEDSIVYYSNPISFNDPFDCNIGISIDQFFKVIAPDLFSESGIDLTSDEKEILRSLMFNESNSKTDLNSSEMFLTKCAESLDFYDLISRVQAGEEVSGVEFLESLSKEPELFTELLKCGLDSNVDFTNIDSDKLLNSICAIPQVLRNLIKNDVLGLDNNTNKLIGTISSEDNFLDKIVNIADMFGLNIPKEDIDKMYNGFESIIKELHISMGNVIGVSCFSEKPDDMLMWSHYAEKHTGICVEYDFSKLFTSVPNSLLLPVSYTSTRPLLELGKLCSVQNGDLVQKENYMKDLLSDILKATITKSLIWNYEHEWRHIVFTKDVTERKAKVPIISSIITGINISPENEKKIQELAQKKQIPVYKTKLKSDRYEMVVLRP